MSKVLKLASLDMLESLKAPSFDVMLVIISTIGASLSALQPLSSSVIIAESILDPLVYFTVALYLAMRVSSGLAELVETGIMEVYMSYPLDRVSLALSLFISRILMPSLIFIGSPLLVAFVLLYKVVIIDIIGFLEVYAAYVIMMIMYGLAFALISLAVMSSASAAALSMTFMFIYMGLGLILPILSSSTGKPLLNEVASALNFNVLVSNYLQGLPAKLWQLILVPIMVVILFFLYLAYFKYRFEPA
jgi:hypothetical protein